MTGTQTASLVLGTLFVLTACTDGTEQDATQSARKEIEAGDRDAGLSEVESDSVARVPAARSGPPRSKPPPLPELPRRNRVERISEHVESIPPGKRVVLHVRVLSRNKTRRALPRVITTHSRPWYEVSTAKVKVLESLCDTSGRRGVSTGDEVEVSYEDESSIAPHLRVGQSYLLIAMIVEDELFISGHGSAVREVHGVFGSTRDFISKNGVRKICR